MDEEKRVCMKIDKIIKKLSSLVAYIFFFGVLFLIEYAICLLVGSVLYGSVLHGEQRFVLAGAVLIVDLAFVLLIKDDERDVK